MCQAALPAEVPSCLYNISSAQTSNQQSCRKQLCAGLCLSLPGFLLPASTSMSVGLHLLIKVAMLLFHPNHKNFPKEVLEPVALPKAMIS